LQPTPSGSGPRSTARRLEQLDRIAGRVLGQHLPPARTIDRVVAEAGAGVAQAPDRRVEVDDLGIGRAADVPGPASQSARPSRSRIANGGPQRSTCRKPSAA